jgi:hypothetical protein
VEADEVINPCPHYAEARQENRAAWPPQKGRPRPEETRSCASRIERGGQLKDFVASAAKRSLATLLIILLLQLVLALTLPTDLYGRTTLVVPGIIAGALAVFVVVRLINRRDHRP